MNLMPSKVGADPKKIVILSVLVVSAGALYFYNSSSGGESGSSTASRRSPVAATAPRVASPSTYRVLQQGASEAKTFRPSMKPKDIDPATVDPTLRLDLLAKLRTVEVEPAMRSLFEIAAAPPAEISSKEPAKIEIKRLVYGPMPPKPVEAPPDPKAPPIPLKFYGFVNKTKVGDKRAFFLDGDEIVIAAEGDVVKKRYKIVRIGVNSAVVEDTDFKSNNQQTLPLEAELTG